MSEIELHRKLLGDTARNAAFHAALKKVIQPGLSTVADLGAGTGFLSFLARQLGAAHCTLVEYSDTLDLAERLAHKNKITGLTFIKAHSAQIKKPPKVDVVVSETLGNFALEENLLETLVDARRYLKKGGVLIPGRLRQFVAPVVSSRLQDELDIWPRVGFGVDLSEARGLSLNNMYVKTVKPEDLADLSPLPLREPKVGASRREVRERGRGLGAQCWDDLDFSPIKTAPSSRREVTLNWSAPSATASCVALPRTSMSESPQPSPARGEGENIYGFALWWECELLPGIVISTSPYAPQTHWEQVYLPLLEPLAPENGDALQLTLTCDTRPEVGVRLLWKTRQLRKGKAVREQAQDTFRGRL